MKRVRRTSAPTKQPRGDRTPTQSAVTIIGSVYDPELFGPWFKRRESWAAWFVFLRALFALPMSAAELEIFQKHTGRTEPSPEPATEAWLVCGRRSGKSFILALVAVYLSVFRGLETFPHARRACHRCHHRQ